MRADGLRNREAILKAAADVFARDGFVIALDRIAVEAGRELLAFAPIGDDLAAKAAQI